MGGWLTDNSSSSLHNSDGWLRGNDWIIRGMFGVEIPLRFYLLLCLKTVTSLDVNLGDGKQIFPVSSFAISGLWRTFFWRENFGPFPVSNICPISLFQFRARLSNNLNFRPTRETKMRIIQDSKTGTIFNVPLGKEHPVLQEVYYFSSSLIS